MSYILEALKKSEQERNLGKVPTISDSVQPPLLSPSSSTGSWMKGILIGTIVLAVSVGAYFTVTKSKPEAASGNLGESKSLMPKEPIPRQVERQALLDNHVQKTKIVPQSFTSAPVASQDILAIKESSLRLLEENRSVNNEKVEKKSSPVQAVIETEVAQNAGPSNNDENKIDLTRDESKDTIPLFVDVQSNSLQTLPDLSLDVHVYDSVQSNRFVFINMTKYREGDFTQEGLAVERIDSKGVILAADGEQFRLPVK